MNACCRKVLAPAGLVALGLALAPLGRANAALILSYNVTGGDNAGTAGSCTDNAPCDTNAAVGQLQIPTLTDGGVTITTTAGSSTKASPTDSLNLSSTTITNNSNATATVTLTISDTSFAAAVNNLDLKATGSFTTAPTSSAKFTFFADTANGQGATAYNVTPGAPLAPFSASSLSFLTNSFSYNNPTPTIGANAPFSLTEQITLVLESKGSFTFNESETGTVTTPTNSVPEPVSLSIVGAGLLGLGLTRRRT